MRYLIYLMLALFLMGSPAFAQDTAPDAGAKAADVTVTSDTKAKPEVEPDGKAGVVPPAEVTAGSPASEDPTPTVTGVDKVPETPEEVGTVINMLLDAAQNGHWTVFVGLLLLLLVWGFNKLGLAAKIGSKWVPWVTVGIGAVVSVSVGLATGAGVLDSLKLGLLEGGIAIALWELLVKHFTKTKADGTPRVAAAAPVEEAPTEETTEEAAEEASTDSKEEEA